MYPQTTSNHLSAIAELIKLLPLLKDLVERSHSLQLATVTSTDDPLNQRRIKVTTENQGGQSESWYVQGGRANCYQDEPVVPVGTTVLVGFAEGNPSDCYLIRTLSNDTNPPDPTQQNPTLDNTEEIPGNERRLVAQDSRHEVGGDHTQEIQGNLSVTCQSDQVNISAPMGDINVSASGAGVGSVIITGDFSVTLQQGGASLVGQNGTWIFSNANGQSWTLGGTSGSEWTFNLGGATLNITGAGDAKINGNSIAVVGAVDSRGDHLVSRGY